ncbi:hypothetical protein K435DRAFT_932878 [Dendrothele bispora CBS 962.96]|uniref:Uncharacterized protein n=1 Tax=Dendrothele bispora (strain CBS 962.96) TaxID=1314807 RepID=A0A4S8L2M9_DENBC|nr:hypothetical protein K435DRAFT_932878 [Dendrothele bispora CBS 962.96]
MGWLKQIRKKIKDGVQQLLIVSDSSDSKDELESDSIQFHISISNKGVIPSPSTESNSSVLGKENHAGEQSSSQESTVQVPVLDNKGKTIAFRELSPVYENTSEEQLKSSAQSCAAVELNLMGIKKPPKINPPELAVFKESVLPQLLRRQKPRVADRLVPGRGALIRMSPKDKYFYPGRLISKSNGKWNVQMWRGIKHKNANKIIRRISTSNIVDGLWQDTKRRRGTLLGKFKRCYEIYEEESAEHYLDDWENHPFDTEIAKALKPHGKTLEQLALLQQSAGISPKDVPVLSLFNQTNPKKTDKVKMPVAAYYCGGLKIDDQARILNWIYTKFPGTNPAHLEIAAAHARTLLLVHRHKTEFLETRPQKNIDVLSEDQYLLKKAWERLVEFTGKTIDGKPKSVGVDVNYEAISILEEVMFDRTINAGIAGNCQWGLDVGPLEDNWFPYNGPEAQQDNLREGSESELEVGPKYQADVQALNHMTEEKLSKPRPRPRLRRKIVEVEDAEEGSTKRLKKSK